MPAPAILSRSCLRLLSSSVPANPAALAVAKSMNVSDEIMSLAFGEHAEGRPRDVSNGEHAVIPPAIQRVNP
jgi:hypothetical protein